MTSIRPLQRNHLHQRRSAVVSWILYGEICGRGQAMTEPSSWPEVDESWALSRWTAAHPLMSVVYASWWRHFSTLLVEDCRCPRTRHFHHPVMTDRLPYRLDH